MRNSIKKHDNKRRSIIIFARLLFVSSVDLILLFNVIAVNNHSRPGVRPSPSQVSKRFLLPPNEGAWRLEIVTGGGYLGSKGNLIITSDGDAAAGRNYPYACTARLTAEELQRLDHLVSSIKLDEYERTEEEPERQGADEIRTKLEMQRRVGDGQTHTNTIVWYNRGGKHVPDSVLALRKAMGEVEKRIIDKCGEYR